MEEKNFLQRALSFIKEHTSFILFWMSIIVLITSWLFVYVEFSAYKGEYSLWVNPSATWLAIVALFVGGLALLYCQEEFDDVYVVDGFVGLLIYWIITSILLIWSLYFGSSYIIPIVITSVAYLIYSYKKHESKRNFAWDMVRFMVVIVAVCSVTYWDTKGNLERQKQEAQLIEMALKQPVIEVMDTQSDCILTKEYGLEQVMNEVPLKKGDKIHRLSIGKKKVYIVFP